MKRNIDYKKLLKPLRDIKFIVPSDDIRLLNDIVRLIDSMIVDYGFDKVEYAIKTFGKSYKQSNISNKYNYLEKSLKNHISTYDDNKFELHDDISALKSIDPIIDKYGEVGFTVITFTQIFEYINGRNPKLDEVLQEISNHVDKTISLILNIEPLSEQDKRRIISHWNEYNLEEFKQLGYDYQVIDSIPSMLEKIQTERIYSA